MERTPYGVGWLDGPKITRYYLALGFTSEEVEEEEQEQQQQSEGACALWSVTMKRLNVTFRDSGGNRMASAWSR